MKLFSKFFTDPNEKFIKGLSNTVEKINGLEKELGALSLDELKNKTKDFKERIQKGENLDSILPEAFAVVREASKRTLKQRHYDVQLIGGIVLHQGKVAEMKTGEGKTLACTLPTYLNALTEKGVHVITVNDYLAKRDAVWMGQIYHALGLSIGCIIHDSAFIYDPSYIEERNTEDTPEEKDEQRDTVGGFKVVEDFLRPVERRQAYQADITYGTNNEFGFDYLRDNMAHNLKDKVQREFHFVIIDEVDSILIDEARTPLIISQPDFESSKLYKELSRIVPNLKVDVDYNTDEKLRAATLTEQGIEKIERILGVDNVYDSKGMKYLHYLEQALRSHTFFHKDKSYIVKQGEVVIIDEFTGRLMPGRRYSSGLHQAIEAKENVEVKPESKILATITFQNYFRMYEKLSGMTGTATTSAEELDKVYKLEVVVVPTNKPLIREALADLIYRTEAGKFKAIIKETKQRNEKGQPVLIGTRSVERNEYLSQLLNREGIKHEILNAKNHQREGEIIAQAGKIGAVTVATNMAGRGVDIVLGGNPSTDEEASKIKELGGLHVIGTERHEARRIDNQLRGRSGRQGDPGSSQFFVSLEDELMKIFGGDKMQNVMNMLKLPEDQPIEAKIISSAIEKAQNKVEGMYFDSRQHILEYDDVMSKHRNKIYSQRNDILKKDYQQLEEFVLDILYNEIESIVFTHSQDSKMNVEEMIEELRTMFPISEEIKQKIKELKSSEAIIAPLNSFVKELINHKQETEGKEPVENILRYACLKSLDMYWTEHLVNMDHLKDAVHLRAYGGKDPLVEYKTEGHRAFQNLWSIIQSQIAHTIFKLSINK
ncbi:MAG: preprotein translocase subunit SecA [Parcubacteria group bacterium]|nr:preprotein translocase subunit SecA [Parcubacteria group bacterium]